MGWLIRWGAASSGLFSEYFIPEDGTEVFPRVSSQSCPGSSCCVEEGSPTGRHNLSGTTHEAREGPLAPLESP